MPRIKIDDLPADEKLDVESMERVRGGIALNAVLPQLAGYHYKIDFGLGQGPSQGPHVAYVKL